MTTRGATIRWTLVGDLLVSCGTSGPISMPVWNDWLREVSDTRVRGVLAASLGPAEVTSVQRKLASEVLRTRNLPVAVVSESSLSRGVITAVSWLGVNIRAFSWGEIPAAIRFLQVSKAAEELGSQALTAVRDACLQDQPSGSLGRPMTK